MPTVKYQFMGLEFEWDSDKAQLVWLEHQITFQEACSVFLDDNEITLIDERFDDDEQRFITIGFSENARLLVVAWTQRDETIRLITAIKAEKKHERRYQNR